MRADLDGQLAFSRAKPSWKVTSPELAQATVAVLLLSAAVRAILAPNQLLKRGAPAG